VPDQLGPHQPDVGMGAEGVEQCAQRVAAHEGVVVEEEEVGAWLGVGVGVGEGYGYG